MFVMIYLLLFMNFIGNYVLASFKKEEFWSTVKHENIYELLVEFCFDVQ